jgi:hypothetical protein
MFTVHILSYGRAFCGIAGLPREWPEGHRWIGFNDVEMEQLANCEACLREKKRRDAVTGKPISGGGDDERR